MPNWCQNTVVITAPRPVIDDLQAVLADNEHGLLACLRPMPPDQQYRWYDWCVSHWGTKWDVTDPCIVNDIEEDSITISFDTAWAPPVAAFQHWAQQDGRVTYRLAYVEPGMGVVGWHSWDGADVNKDYAEQAHNPDRYWQLAAEEFGMEPDEEPEPLTEWLVQGVQERGLT